MLSASVERVAVDRPVIERQHLVDLAEFVVEQRQMPPIVHLQEAVASSSASGLARIQAMPSRCAALHLHDMGDRVLRPAVARLELDRLRGRAPRRGA